MTSLEIFKDFKLAPVGAKKTSHSEVELYTKCQRAHFYAYGKGLSTKRMSDALARGILGHAALATYYTFLKEGITDKDFIWAEVQKVILAGIPEVSVRDLLPVIAEVHEIIKDYIDYYWERDQQLEVLAVEQEFNVPVGDEFYIKMIVDLIVRVPNSGIEIWDHKFVYNFFSPEVEKVIPQLPKYLGACRSIGINVNKVAYNEIRYRLTKSNQDNPEEKFHRTVVDVNKNRVITTLQEQIRAARQIKYLQSLGLEEWGNTVLRAANSNICKNCPFLQICASDLKGEDTKLIEEYNYNKRENDYNG